MRFGSVCSGIEAASVAWHPLGWSAAWLSEIEPFPCAVLAHHYPDVPNLGDMTKLPDMILTGEVEAPDLFCGGTPCQAFSVAGLRKSLDDARGNLSLVFCEIANAIDHVRFVRSDSAAIIFWENVPGVLNTKDNAFGCFLAGLAGEDDPLIAPGGRWTNAGCVFGPQRTVAWRVLDAQYFGVAQRRRRVFVVASARADFDPAAVLFEFEGVRRDTAPSREKGQRVAPGVTAGAKCGSGVKYAHYSHSYAHDRLTDPSGVNPALTKEAHASGNLNIITMAHGQGGAEIAEDRSPTLTCNHEAPIAVYASEVRPCQFCKYPFDHEKLGRYGCPNCEGQGGVFIMQPAYTTKLHNTTSNQSGKVYEEYSTSLDRSSPPPALLTAMQVRRLTPVECERLQGFPDGYTDIKLKNRPTPDGPRYKALGNSWAVPVARWLGARIQEQACRKNPVDCTPVMLR